MMVRLLLRTPLRVSRLQRTWVPRNRAHHLVDRRRLRHRFASPTTLVFRFLCIGDNCMPFCWGWGKWIVSVRVKSDYPNSLSSFGVFLPVFFFPKRLITFSVKPACLYLLYIV